MGDRGGKKDKEKSKQQHMKKRQQVQQAKTRHVQAESPQLSGSRGTSRNATFSASTR